MERQCVCMRDNNPSLRPSENPAGPSIRAEPSHLTPNGRDPDTEACPARPPRPPSTANSQHAEKSPPRSNPLSQGYERPGYSRLAILAALCIITYPIFYILTRVAKDKSLLIVRSIASVWCSGVGFALGYIILKIGSQYLEAATWATVIHMSYDGGGMKLHDLASNSDDATSPLTAVCVFWSRFRNRQTVGRRSRKSYDKRPWSLFIGFFVVLTILPPILPFLFGRVVLIETFVVSQHDVYREVLVAGDLSVEDIIQANSSNTSFSESVPDTTELVYDGDTVYFAQPSLSQFVPGGSGAGNFNPPKSIGQKDPANNSFPPPDPASMIRKGAKGADAILRYPQWGIRIRCRKLPDPEVNLIPLSNRNFTYAIVPRDLLRDLFGMYGMDLPTRFTEPDLKDLDTNDANLSSVNRSTTSYLVRWPDNGESISLHSTWISDPDPTADHGWTTVETVLIRFDTSYTPSGRFPRYLNKSSPNANGIETRIGYDAAVCVQKYESWIIKVYNTSIVPPYVVDIIGRGDKSTSLSPGGIIQGAQIMNKVRYLNTTEKGSVASSAHDNSANRTWQSLVNSDQGNYWGNYIPPPIAVYLTESESDRHQGFVELSPDWLAVIRARVGAAGALPYLVGSGPVVAQSYEDETLAYATYIQWQLISLPMFVLILGIIGELFKPTLPFNIPRRDFGVYSWLVLLQSQVLRVEAADELDNSMTLKELEKKFSDKRVEFVHPDFPGCNPTSISEGGDSESGSSHSDICEPSESDRSVGLSEGV